MRPRSCPAWVPAAVLLATVAQLLVAEYWPGIERFADKAFGARLVAYPLLMLAVPVAWWLVSRRRADPAAPPYGAFTLVMLPFLVDVTGNSLDLYDAVAWWDDLNHFGNWLLLCTGLGLIVCARVRPRWAVVVLVTGIGALLAIGWELGEWYTFIRHGTELDTAYEDTLGDEALGTLGAFVAGLVVASVLGRRRARTEAPRAAAG
ncbi:hypothetical protein [Nocardioides donggukensis]|uniref:DUF2238 domain-containing protein n=1 Tax=Nocardioides donggukensis TaxID=2774019 RepID=A0A927K883_9ACTN|nr:hypothetical protein [Nocardioides donggukensis]MBD8869455.1 hypothetical protein [Nocardioides donggukensis]